MSVKVVIQQPNYIPWIGQFDMMRQADVWVWLENVQYTKDDWRNRNKIASGSGAPCWLTIPVQTRGRFGQLISEAQIDYRRDWVGKHLSSLRQSYGKAPYGPAMLEVLEEHLSRRPRLLVDLTVPLGEAIGRALNLSTTFRLASELAPEPHERNVRVRALCAAVHATDYLSGPSARDYLDVDALSAAGVRTHFASYRYPPYARGPHEARAGLSIVDPWSWLGPDALIRYVEQNTCLPSVSSDA